MEIKNVLDSLGSGLDGLSTTEAVKRLETCGRNELKEGKKRTVWIMLLDQFKDFMILILIAAAIISGLIGDVKDTVAIIVIVVLNAVIGFVQGIQGRKSSRD